MLAGWNFSWAPELDGILPGHLSWFCLGIWYGRVFPSKTLRNVPAFAQAYARANARAKEKGGGVIPESGCGPLFFYPGRMGMGSWGFARALPGVLNGASGWVFVRASGWGFARASGGGFARASGWGFARASGWGFAWASGWGFARASGWGFAWASGWGFARASGWGFAWALGWGFARASE